jgi:hypothetical protein
MPSFLLKWQKQANDRVIKQKKNNNYNINMILQYYLCMNEIKIL